MIPLQATHARNISTIAHYQKGIRKDTCFQILIINLHSRTDILYFYSTLKLSNIKIRFSV